MAAAKADYLSAVSQGEKQIRGWWA